MLKNITFEYPWVLGFTLLLVLLVVWYIWRHDKLKASVRYSSLVNFERSKTDIKTSLRHLPFILRLLAMLFLIIATARPQTTLSRKDINVEGIDIIIGMDISGSMLARDFKPNRLEASKDVAKDFIAGRPNDRIGLVIFSGEAFTQCPLTTDHAVLINLFDPIESGMVEDGTAIGDGLATAINRLKDSEAISKVIILITDGVNNLGYMDPMTAAEIAKLYGIRVYTIGVGSMGKAYTPVGIYPDGSYAYEYVDVRIDENMLENVAEMTDGRYFRATNKKKLIEIYREIDALEKSKIDVTEFHSKDEKFLIFLIIAGALFMTEFLTRYVFLRTIP